MKASSILGIIAIMAFGIAVLYFLTPNNTSDAASQTTTSTKETAKSSGQKEAVKTESSSISTTTTTICTPNWQCDDWSVCTWENKQLRTCVDKNSCNNNAGKPSETLACEYLYYLGDTIEKSGLSIKLKDVRTSYRFGTYYQALNRYQEEAESGKKFVIIYLEVTNKGDKNKYVSPSDVYLLEENRIQYKYDSSTYSLPDRFERQDLLSGSKEVGELSFSMPENINISSLKVIYTIDSYNNIYGTWDLNKTIVIESGSKACGNTGQPCCDNKCTLGNICSNNVCQTCGGYGQRPCDSGCAFGTEVVNGKCVIARVAGCESMDSQGRDFCYSALGSVNILYCDLLNNSTIKNWCQLGNVLNR